MMVKPLRSTRKHVFFIIIIGVVFLLLWKLLTSSPNDPIDFTAYDNVTGFGKMIVPNIVHFFKLQNHTVSFTEMVNILAVRCHQRPEQIFIHCDCDDLEGRYWDRVKDFTELRVHRVSAPKAVFGRPFSSVYHSADVLRLSILSKYGGIALDFDTYVVRSLDYFRRFEFSLGWPPGANIGTQTLIAHRDARFLKIWLNSYKHYRPELWYYNAGQLPTEILNQHPYLVHRVPLYFGVHMLVSELYKTLWPHWRTYYTIHLLIRHRDYLDKNSPIKTFDEYNICTYPFTYGQMVRSVIYGTSETVSPNHNLTWKLDECENGILVDENETLNNA